MSVPLQAPAGRSQPRKSTHAMRKEGMATHGTADLIEGYYEREWKATDAWGVKVSRWLAVRIWYGPPIDPDTGDELDRSWRWMCVQDGTETDPYEVWPWVCHRPISPEQYCELLKESLS